MSIIRFCAVIILIVFVIFYMIGFNIFTMDYVSGPNLLTGFSSVIDNNASRLEGY